jgi:hypothetical protein
LLVSSPFGIFDRDELTNVEYDGIVKALAPTQLLVIGELADATDCNLRAD